MPKAKPAIPEEAIKVKIQKTQARFRRVRESKGPDAGVGEFFLLVDITAVKDDIFVPLSIASGKKPTGFVYEIEGTAEGVISTTTLSCKGAGVSQITLGTLLYCKIPATKTATFRILVEIRGKVGAEYKVVINSINFKKDPSNARYEKYLGDLLSKPLKFK